METAKIFQNGRSQAVRLPKEYRFDGTEVFIRKIDNIVMLFPKDQGWNSLVQSLDKFSDDFMTERSQPANDEREGL